MKKNTKYIFMWGQKQSAMVAECMVLNFAVKNKDFTITKGIDDVVREHNKGFSYIYFSDRAIEKGFDNGKGFLNKKDTKTIYSKIDKHIKESAQFYTKLRKVNYQKLTNKEIVDYIKKYFEQLLFGQKLFRSSDPSSTKMVEEKIKSILKKKYKEDQLIEKFISLVTPTETDKTQQEIIDLYNLILNKQVITDDVLLIHALNYSANYANAWSYQEIVKYLRDELKKNSLVDLKKEIEQIKYSKLAIKKVQEQLFQEFNNNVELKHCALVLQNLALKRFELKHSWAGSETQCLGFLQFLAKQIGLDFRIFMESYNFTDLLNFYSKKNKLSANEIDERQNYSIIHYQKGKLLYLYGKKAESYFKKIYNIESAGQVKGMIANKGLAVGLARIVRVNDLSQFVEDSKAFQKGEILVTTMTSPIMLSLASKAAAIITNEGGVCSHAAVIARELNIPCIVGTHDATNILKTGDKIEVDANTGMVNKII